MTPDSTNPVLYACIAWRSTVLAELSSGDPDIDALALRCLGKAPALHLHYSHAVRKRIYAFLMADPFIYFAIAHEVLGKTQCLLFLERLRATFSSWFLNNCPNHGSDALSFRCFQDEFGPVFRRLLPPLLSAEVNPDRKVTSKATEIEGGVTPDKGRKGEMQKIEDNAAILDNKETSETKKVEEIRAVQELGSKWARLTIVFIDLVVCSLLFGIWLSARKASQRVVS